MSFQTTVNLYPGYGVPGELADDSAVRCEPFLLNSASPNVFGYAFTVSSQGTAAVGNVGANRIFAGYLVNPKNSALYGVGGDVLAPTLILPNLSNAQLLNMGCIWVSLALPSPGQINIGDLVIYDNTTGALSTIAPGVALPVGKSSGYAVVDRYTPNAATGAGQFGLAVIRVTNTPEIPVLA